MAHLRMCSRRLGHHGLATLRLHSDNMAVPITLSRGISEQQSRFFERHKKGSYKDIVKIDVPTKQLVKEGLSMLGTELGKFKDEVKMKLRADPIVTLEAGDYEVLWKFDDQDTLDKWVLTTDQDLQEGKSSAELILGRNKTALFQGAISTEIPKDGVIKCAGYANMRSPKNMLSFYRENPYDWNMYTHLVMRVRGDGRAYRLLIHMDRYFDIQWNDQYHYTLYTRGGPYWQTAKIPFSKFYLTGKGRVQDKQDSIVNQLLKVSYMGITICDNNPGPFQLEIDYIGLIYDASHTEHFPYEMYKTSNAALG